MQERIFRFDIPSHEWTECTEERYDGGNPGCVPTIVLVNRQEAATLPMRQEIWCEKHRDYEEVERWEGDTLITEAGCRMWGFAAEVTQYGTPPCGTSKKATFSWRIVLRDDGTVFIGANKGTIEMRERLDPISRERLFVPRVTSAPSEGLSIQFPKNKLLPQGEIFPIPSVIADVAIEFLRWEAERLHGQQIIMPPYSHSGSFADGTIRLFAFLHNPLHIAFWYYRDLFRKGANYKKTLPRGEEDVSAYLCEAVGCKPTKAIRAKFEENPLFPAMAAMLQYLGVQEESLQLRFSHLQTFFGESPIAILNHLGQYPFSPSWKGVPPSNVFTDAETARSFLRTGNGTYSEWPAMLFYSRWRLFHEGETRLAEHLYNMNENWTPRFMDASRKFYNCWLALPDELQNGILRDGLTEDMHNRMIRLANENALGRPDFSYSLEEKGYECRIGDYVFQLIDNRAEFHALLQEAGTTDSEKQIGARDNGSLRAAMYRKAKVVAVILLDGQAHLYFNPHYNDATKKLESAHIRIAFLRWLKWTGLYRRYEPFWEADYEYLREEVQAEPLSECPSRLWEMLSLPEEKFRPGDYLRLYQMFVKAELSCFVTLPRNAFANEIDYLMQAFPYGKPIYEAALKNLPEQPFEDADREAISQFVFPRTKKKYQKAFSGNREAAYVLSLLYSDWNSPFPKDEERGEYWKTLAEKGR